ncbi:MAG: hypothetical protein FVQ80_09825 [Planctomycetes bacterium]|nr:hypothetical protein [Planctomycetota bacterium]
MFKSNRLRFGVSVLFAVLFIFAGSACGQSSGRELLGMMRNKKGVADKACYMNRAKERAEEALANEEHPKSEQVDPFSKYKKVELDFAEPLVTKAREVEKPARKVPKKVSRPVEVKRKKKSVKKAVRDTLLSIIPADSLFVIRVNHLEHNANKLDQYLADASPLPMGISMLVRSQLAGALGDPELKGIKIGGNFAVFGIAVNDKISESKPLDIFVGVLIPVPSYKKFVSESPLVGKANSKGVSKIKREGGDDFRAIRVGTYALVTPSSNSKKLVEISKSMLDKQSGSIVDVLTETEQLAARKEAFWGYGNIQVASETLGSLMLSSMDGMQVTLKEMEERGGAPMGDAARQMETSKAMLEKILGEGKSVSIVITPKLKVLNIALNFAALPGSDMAKMMMYNPMAKQENKLLGYLEDDAMMNIAFWIDKDSTIDFIDMMVDTVMNSEDSPMPEADIKLIKGLAMDMLESSGGAFACSVDMDAKSESPMTGKYAFEVGDIDKFNSSIDKVVEVFNSQSVIDFYKTQGMEVSFDLNRGVDKYKGASIDSAKMTMKSLDSTNPQAQMIDALYKGGFNYRWAVVDGIYVCALGGKAGRDLEGMIDLVRDGGPKGIAPGVRSTISLVDYKGAEFVGTFNYLKQIQAVLSAMRESGNPMPMPIPEIDTISESAGIAFAGRGGDGEIIINVALPKNHLAEITEFFGEMRKGTMPQGQAGQGR